MFHSGDAHGGRNRAEGSLLLTSWFGVCTLGFSPVNERLASQQLWVREPVQTDVCAYAPDTGLQYSVFLESLVGVLKSAPTEDSIVLLRDLSACMGNGSAT